MDVKCYLLLFAVVFFCAPVCLASVEEADCFEYYKFQNGIVYDDLRSDKYLHSVGEDVIFSYNLVNRMGSPVVEGKVRYQIIYDDPKEGEQILEESFAYKDINLMPGDNLAQTIRWSVPATAKPGKYSVKLYFLSGEYFNLAGLSFNPYGPPGVPGAMTMFEVANPMPGYRIYFSKDATYVNNIRYSFTNFLSSRSDSLEIKTLLVNEGPEDRVHLNMSVYDWDDVSEKPLPEYLMEKDIEIAADSSIDLSYSLPKLDSGTYSIRFAASSRNGMSIMKLRVSVPGARGRLGYMGMDRSPLIKGESGLLFYCLSNSANYRTSFNGTGAIELVDGDGTSIVRETYALEVTPAPVGRKLRFVPGKDVTNATLRITLYDQGGKLMDKQELRYDYSDFMKVSARLELSTEKKQFSLGEKIPYSISFSDMNERPLLGRVLLYVIDSKGKVVSLIKSREVSGTFHGLLEIPSETGEYGFIIREVSRDLKAETSFAVLSQVPDTTQAPASTLPEAPPEDPSEGTLPEEKAAEQKDELPGYLYPAAGMAALALILLVLAGRKRR